MGKAIHEDTTFDSDGSCTGHTGPRCTRSSPIHGGTACHNFSAVAGVRVHGQKTDTPRTMTDLQGKSCTTKGTTATCANYGFPTVAGRPMRYVVLEFFNEMHFHFVPWSTDVGRCRQAEADEPQWPGSP